MAVRRRTAAGAAAIAVAAVGMWPVAPAQAHGAPVNPVSRTAACAEPGAGTADSAACRAARRANDGEFGTFDNLRVPDIGGRDRELIPDGKLCSAGLDNYQGLDLARDDWPATTMPAGSTIDVRYRTTIPHPGSFRFYLTTTGYDPSEPLSWDALDRKPLLTAKEPPLRGGAYRMSLELPANRTGRHLLYTVWQTTDSTDTYYSCSDLVLTAKAGSATAGRAKAEPSASPSTGGAKAGGGPTSRPGAGVPAAPPAADGGAADTGPADTGPADTGPADVGADEPDTDRSTASAVNDEAAPAQGTELERTSRLEPVSVAGKTISLGQQLVTAALVVLAGVAGGLAFLRIRASRAQRLHRRPENR